ncbi:FadR/GntR family transcriptional regulator, partial [Pseudonocardia pini]|uniref:FadR/GntR family transcriptional regulator n=1 Tax=Pseudonocardia pini TaxID=2758030 RepID=UPI0015F0E305
MTTAGARSEEVAEPLAEDDPTLGGKLAARIARAVEAEVISRGWPVGASLGSEPELRARFDVSPTVLREAVRILEHRQVARMRRGPNGGLVVEAPDGRPAISALIIYLEYRGTSMAHLFQARRLLEPVAAELAARRIDEAGIAAVREILAEEAAREPVSPRGFGPDELHDLVSAQSGNPVLQLLIDALGSLTHRYVRAPWRAPDPEVLRTLRIDTQRWHRLIGEAVVAGDGALARVRFDQHLDDALGVLSSQPDHRTPLRGPGFGDSPAGPGASLTETVAGHLFDEITRRGWPLGVVLGSENELMERFAVGRAVLRAAIRLLELHSVVRTRRGPGGGLVVAQPDQRAGIDISSVYLAYRGAAVEDLEIVREAIVLGAAAEVADRLPGDETRRTLTAAEAEGTAALDRALVHLTDNPVLLLFVGVISDL